MPDMRGRCCAPDYDPLPKCESWCGVIWGYVTNPKLGAYSRVKRRKEVDASESARTLFLLCPPAPPCLPPLPQPWLHGADGVAS